MPLVFAFITSPIAWVVVALIAFLLFGNRLPSVMRSLGQGMNEFKKGLDEGAKTPPPDEQKQVEDTSSKTTDSSSAQSPTPSGV